MTLLLLFFFKSLLLAPDGIAHNSMPAAKHFSDLMSVVVSEAMFHTGETLPVFSPPLHRLPLFPPCHSRWFCPRTSAIIPSILVCP